MTISSVPKEIHIFSSGGGVQSTACLVLSAQGVIDYPVHVFSNVGDRAESPQTVAYVRDVLKPYAVANGIEWIEVAKQDRAGNAIDLLDKLESSAKSVPIPVRMAGSGAPGNRSCTIDWKIQPVAKYLKALIPKNVTRVIQKETRSILNKQEKYNAQCERYIELFPISLGKGISTDEANRAKSFTGFAHYQAKYPLIELGLSRADCEQIIKKAGLPPAPKSSCWFCPYKTKNKWQELRQNNPALFAQAVTLEKLLHSRSMELGRGGCFFTSTGSTKHLFLDAVTSPHYQGNLFHGFDDSECESGHCWT